jgi:16S rRNA C967 or C1407 C5-methylase (RsmB/RsmF family)/NOL1/NOP2/fmu family ribosome biogenesis protein
MLPLAFIQQTQPLLGDQWEAFEQAIQNEIPVSIRLNDKFPCAQPYPQVPWCSSGYYLPSRPLFTADPLLHAGAYYVQEAGSMFMEQIIKQYIDSPVRALDLCAAPGGKATHLTDLLPEGSFLIANETIRQRANILAENMQKWGNPNVAVTNNSVADLGRLSTAFDLIVTDVPCSGEGMFRKDPNAIEEWSLANVDLCAARQRAILSDIWPALKEDGLLVYSTCTYNRKENEENIQWIAANLGAEILSVDIPETWGVTRSDSGYRFYPHKTRSEGFFISVLRKTISAPSLSKKNRSKDEAKKKTSTLASLPFINLLQSGNWLFREINGKISAYDEQFDDIVQLTNKLLHPIFCGILLGEKKGTDFIPHPALALSKKLNRKSFVLVDVDWKVAINYLHREAIVLSDNSKGFLLISFRGIPIGWVKNLGNRANNLYPVEWRIRMNIDMNGESDDCYILR